MARSQTIHHCYLFGSLPNRRCFVPSQLLTKLVIVAALVQIIPVGVASSRAGLANTDLQLSASESLTASTHPVQCWTIQPTGAGWLAVTKARDSELVQGDWGRFSSVLVMPSSLPNCEKQSAVGRDSCCLFTLVDLNVRLQI